MSAHAIRRFRDEGFEVFALSPDEYALETYEDEYKKKDDVIFYNVCPPFKEYNLFPKTEIVYQPPPKPQSDQASSSSGKNRQWAGGTWRKGSL